MWFFIYLFRLFASLVTFRLAFLCFAAHLDNFPPLVLLTNASSWPLSFRVAASFKSAGTG
jgi:hypothetical protein